jgi:hypothetical protein
MPDKNQINPATILNVLTISGNRNEKGIVTTPLTRHNPEMVISTGFNRGSFLINPAPETANTAHNKKSAEITTVLTGAKNVPSVAD